MAAVFMEWGGSIAAESILHPAWAQTFSLPFLHHFVLRFVFARATFSLHSTYRHDPRFLPECSPSLVEADSPTWPIIQSGMRRIACVLDVVDQFVFSGGGAHEEEKNSPQVKEGQNGACKLDENNSSSIKQGRVVVDAALSTSLINERGSETESADFEKGGRTGLVFGDVGEVPEKDVAVEGEVGDTREDGEGERKEGDVERKRRLFASARSEGVASAEGSILDSFRKDSALSTRLDGSFGAWERPEVGAEGEKKNEV